MIEGYKVQLGQNIQRRRRELGMTQGDLATATHFKDAQTVSRWERGENVPSDLEVVATALTCTVPELMADIKPPNATVARKLGLAVPEDDAPNLVVVSGEPSQIDRMEAEIVRQGRLLNDLARFFSIESEHAASGPHPIREGWTGHVLEGDPQASEDQGPTPSD